MSISIKTATAENFTMNYFTFGKGETPFVILPGLSVQSVMGSADIISEAYSIIAEHFTVYVFDRRNELPCSYTVYDMANDTAEIFNILGLDNICLFGASQGGMIAQVIAAENPKLIKKLMLGSSCVKITDAQLKAVEAWIEEARNIEKIKLSTDMGKALHPENVYKQYENVFIDIGKSITDEEMSRFIITAQGTKGFDMSKRINEIKCPVLSLGSEDDKVLVGAAKELEEAFKGRADFESYIYNGYGHAAYDTAPDYKERLLKFAIK